VKSLKW